MSVMCSMKGCSEKSGMCGHEKMMAIMMVMGVIAAIAHFGFGLF